jgi:hypothetical protein
MVADRENGGLADDAGLEMSLAISMYTLLRTGVVILL